MSCYLLLGKKYLRVHYIKCLGRGASLQWLPLNTPSLEYAHVYSEYTRHDRYIYIYENGIVRTVKNRNRQWRVPNVYLINYYFIFYLFTYMYNVYYYLCALHIERERGADVDTNVVGIVSGKHAFKIAKNNNDISVAIYIGTATPRRQDSKDETIIYYCITTITEVQDI